MELVHSLFVQSCLTAPEDEELVTEKDWETFLNVLSYNGIANERDVLKLEDIWKEYRSGFMRNSTSGSGRTNFNLKRNQPLNFPDFIRIFVGDPAFNTIEQEDVVNAVERLNERVSNIGKLAEQIQESDDPLQLRLVMKLTAKLLDKSSGAKTALKQACKEQEADFYAKISLQRDKNNFGGEPVSSTTSHKYQENNRSGIEKLCEASRISGRLLITDFSGRPRSNAYVLPNHLGHAYLNKKGDHSSQEYSAYYESVLATNNSDVRVEAVRRKRNNPDPTQISIYEAGCFGMNEAKNYIYNCHAAHRELIQSKYFPKWMGSYFNHKVSDFWICYEYHQTKSFASLIDKNGKLEENRPLAKHVAYEFLLALSDLHDMSTFSILEPITENSIFLVDHGTKLMLGNISWGENYYPINGKPNNDKALEDWCKERESKLRHGYGQTIKNCFRAGESLINNTANSLKSFTLDDCEKGEIEIVVGSTLHLQLNDSELDDDGYHWVCEHVDSSNSVLKRCKDPLKLYGSRVGICDILLLKVDSWASDINIQRDSAYEELFCSVKVTPNPEHQTVVNGLSAPMQALVSACAAETSDSWHLTLNQLKKFKFFERQRGEAILGAVAEDYTTLSKRIQ